MPPQNRLARPLTNSLAYSVPVPLEPGMMRPAPAAFSPRRELENLSIGMGRGAVTGMEGTKQLLTQPVATAQALIEAARQLGTDPAVILDMLRAARQRAMSGSLGLGELLGENVTPGMRPRGPNMARMGGPEDFMRRREKQLIAEEDAEAKSLMREMDERRYQQDIAALMENKDWLSQTERRADVVSKLRDLGLPWLGSNPHRSIFQFNRISEQVKKFENPLDAFNARANIASSKADIDKDFDEYISKVREYRKTLNPRSKYDRETIKRIDTILGDVRVTQLKPK